MGKAYSKEVKEKIINQYLTGVTITEISKEHHLARSTIYTWLKDYNKVKRTKPINMHEVLLLRQKCEQLELMIEILQTTTCSTDAPLKDKYEAIKELSHKYSINLLCKTLKVAKGSYYNHIFRNKNENTEAAKRRAELTPIIEQIFNDSQQVYGAGKIHAILQNSG